MLTVLRSHIWCEAWIHVGQASCKNGKLNWPEIGLRGKICIGLCWLFSWHHLRALRSINTSAIKIRTYCTILINFSVTHHRGTWCAEIWVLSQVTEGSRQKLKTVTPCQIPQQTVNNRKSLHMLPQSLDIFKISGTVDNYHISIVPFKFCWYICVNVIFMYSKHAPHIHHWLVSAQKIFEIMPKHRRSVQMHWHILNRATICRNLLLFFLFKIW